MRTATEMLITGAAYAVGAVVYIGYVFPAVRKGIDWLTNLGLPREAAGRYTTDRTRALSQEVECIEVGGAEGLRRLPDETRK